MNSNKILFLSTQLPYPPKSGGTVKSWNFVKYLSKNYQLTVACLLKGEDEQHTTEFEKAIQIDSLISESCEVSRNPFTLLKSYFTAPCLNVYRNASASFKNRISSISNDFNIIIVDHYEMFQYVQQSYKGKVIMHTHNAEFMLWQRMSELSSNPIKKAILKLEAARVKKYEQEIFERSDLIFSTPSDIELYQKHGFNIAKHSITYHLGNDQLIDLADLQYNETEKALTFIGTLSWEPNIDGIVWFIENCWAAIQSKQPDCVLYILGGSPDQRILKAANNNPQIIFTGFIKDLETYLKKTRVYIAPLRFGSGMKVKVLEGLYRGVPTVSTSVGTEGLEVQAGQEILIGDDAADFANSCIQLMEDEQLWNKLRDNSRKVAAKKYRWKPLFEQMNIEIKKLYP